MLSILLRIFGDAQHSCSANGTHIAGLISEVPAKISSELPRHVRLGRRCNIPTDIGCVLGPDLAAKTSEHLSMGFQKLPSVFPSVFCTMNYTVLGSQIPHLSKETHKKTSMTVHLSLKCECSMGKTTPCKYETSYVYNTSSLLVSIRELKWTQSHIVTWLKEAVKPLIPKKAGCLFISA